jgi:hypothetical protein
MYTTVPWRIKEHDYKRSPNTNYKRTKQHSDAEQSRDKVICRNTCIRIQVYLPWGCGGRKSIGSNWICHCCCWRRTLSCCDCLSDDQFYFIVKVHKPDSLIGKLNFPSSWSSLTLQPLLTGKSYTCSLIILTYKMANHLAVRLWGRKSIGSNWICHCCCCGGHSVVAGWRTVWYYDVPRNPSEENGRELARGNGEVKNVSEVRSLDASDTVFHSSAFHSDTKLIYTYSHCSQSKDISSY